MAEACHSLPTLSLSPSPSLPLSQWSYLQQQLHVLLGLPAGKVEEMSGVWVFNKKGVARLIPNPTRESFEQDGDSSSSSSRPGTATATAPGARPRVLVYVPANHVIRSYADLELRLAELGWSRYRNPAAGCHLLQFHRSDDTADLISLPRNFADFKPLHMYDIVVKNRSFFEVRHPPPPP